MGGVFELMIGLTAAAVLLAALMPIQSNLQQSAEGAAAAGQMRMVRDAAAAFIQDNWQTINACFSTSPVQTYSLANLANTTGTNTPCGTALSGGYLPASMSTSINPWRQSYTIYLHSPATNQLQGLVLTSGGIPIPASIVASVASWSGEFGGYVPYASDPHLPAGCGGGTCAVGAAGFWNDKLTNYNLASAAQGSLAAGLFFSQGQAVSPYLYRYNTGVADANTMHTDIDMNSNNIKDATSLQVSGIDTTVANSSGGLEHTHMDMINNLYNGTYTSNNGNLTLGSTALAACQSGSNNFCAGGTITAGGAISTNNGDISTSSGNISTSSGSITATGGTVTAAGFYHSSDARLKENIQPIRDPLALVERLIGHRFDWRASGQPDLGFVAQEVQAVVPEAVAQTSNGTLAVKYDVLEAPLVEAVKQLTDRVDGLELQLARQKEMAAAVDPTTGTTNFVKPVCAAEYIVPSAPGRPQVDDDGDLHAGTVTAPVFYSLDSCPSEGIRFRRIYAAGLSHPHS